MEDNKSNIKDNKAEVITVENKTPKMSFPHFEYKEVWIKKKENTSAFKTLNKSSFIDSIEKIGASFKGQEVAKGLTPAEEARFLPQIIGVQFNEINWHKASKDYWLNISKVIPDGGLKLEIGLVYNSQEDYDYDKKQTLKQNYDGVSVLINPKGNPINLSDYILWRYCLIYSKVANNLTLIGASKNISFYIYSKESEINAKKAQFKSKMEASKLLFSEISNRDWANWLLRVLVTNDTDLNKKYTIGQIPLFTSDEVDIALNEYCDKNPLTFIMYGTDKKLEIKAFIEECIVLGRLSRIANTQTIVFENQTIGNSLDQTVAFLSDAKNANILNTLKAQIKINV